MITLTLPDGRSIEIENDGRQIEDILEEFDINPVEVIVARNGVIVSELEAALPGDEIKVVRIIHGG